MDADPAKSHGSPDPDVEIERFVAEHHEEIAAKLAAGRDQIRRGEMAPLGSLEDLLLEARAVRVARR
jgi:hypothetical protein